jgi:hypothetical protein
MPFTKLNFLGLSKALMLVITAIVIYGYCNYIRLDAALAVIKSVGPSEYRIGVKLGLNPRCGLTFVSVGFWQQGPGIPERQGYICGGLFTSAKMEVVPFDQGLILEEIT